MLTWRTIHAALCGAIMFVLSGSVSAQTTSPTPSFERYVSASVDAAGNLAIRTASGETRLVVKEDEAHHFGSARISKDGSVVGVTAWSLECCQSSPIPTRIVVYASGSARRFDANCLSIEAWHFTESGRQLALSASQHHVFCAHFYRLFDIRSGAQRAESTEELQCQYIERPKVIPQPRWVQELAADRAAWNTP